MYLGEKIITLRKKQGWSQEELGFHLDVSRQTVSQWEKDLFIPDIDKIIKMSEIFGVTTDYLLRDSETEPTVQASCFMDEEDVIEEDTIEKEADKK